MKKKKTVILGCSLGCLSATIMLIIISVLIFVLTMPLFMQFDIVIGWGGWRSNVYRYRENWLRTNEESDLWREGAYLLWHNGESFEMVYSLIEHPRYTPAEIRGWVDNVSRERIGRVRNLPEINPFRPDVNFIHNGRVYEIEGLNSREWIYVLYEETHNWVIFNWHHRIYKSTNLEIEDPIKFLQNYIDGIGLIDTIKEES